MTRTVQTTLWLLLLVAASLLAGRSVYPGTDFVILWPAAGIGIAWLSQQRLRWESTVLMSVAVVAVSRATLPDWTPALILAASTMTQVAGSVWLMRRWCPDAFWGDGSGGFDRLAVWWRLLAAYVVPAVGSGLLGALLLNLLVHEVDPLLGTVWVLRNLGGATVIATGILLVADWRRRDYPLRRGADPALQVTAEVAVGVAGTVLVFILAFGTDQLPLAFPLILPSVWFALRFPPVVSVVHTFAIGYGAVVLSNHSRGPFAMLSPRELTPTMTLVFVLLCALTGMVISVGANERRALATRLQASRSELAFNLDLLDGVIASVDQSLIVITSSGSLLMQNAAASRLLSDASGELSVTNWFDLDITPVRGQAWQDDLSPAQRALAGQPAHDDVTLTAAGGERRVLRVIASPVRPSSSNPGRTLAVLLVGDVTEEHEARASLARYAGVVAHDLSAPLAVIEGWVEILADEITSGELDVDIARDFTSRVGSAATSMHGLITDLLGHATSARADLRQEPVDLTALVQAVAVDLDASGMVSVETLPRVNGDEVLLRQLFTNLVGNALKYVPHGSEPKVEVTGERRGGEVVVRVADWGIGIAPEDRERVFHEFERVSQDGYRGTGLGLDICRRIVERHRGRIRALENPAGQGTVMEMTLPAVPD